jgi:hypothetical protein
MCFAVSLALAHTRLCHGTMHMTSWFSIPLVISVH